MKLGPGGRLLLGACSSGSTGSPADVGLPDAGGLGSREAGGDLTPPADPPLDLATLAPAETIAKRLAALVWNQPPDPAVLETVSHARTRADFRALARTMLADPRARRGVSAFFTWLLRLDDLVSQPKPDAAILS